MPQPRTVQKQLAIHETLFSLGFSAHEIFVAWKGGPQTLVNAQGKKLVLSYPGGAHPPEETDYIVEWITESQRWAHELSVAERTKVCRENLDSEMVSLLVGSLKSQGFQISPLPDLN
jgi:hypothetical protein